MVENGLVLKSGQGMTRIEIRCIHQSGVFYVVPSEKSWVCSEEHMAAHSLAGFLTELTGLADPRVQELMQSWGIYFRQLPLEEEHA